MGKPADVLGRRQFLPTMTAVAGAATVAGCSAIWDQPDATGVIAYNATAEGNTVSVAITEADAGNPRTSKTREIPPGKTVDPVNRSKLPTNTGYTVEVNVEGGPSETFEWDDPDVELAPLYVLVDGARNITVLLRAG